MLNKIIFRIVAAMLLLCVLWIAWVWTITLLGDRDKEVPCFNWTYKEYYNACDILYKDLYNNVCNFTNEQYREYIEKDLNLKFYIYKEDDLINTLGLDGNTNAILRTIWIDETLTDTEYCETFVHEAMHLKKCIKNETYVCYETFKYLYEDEVLHNVGVVYGWQQMNKSEPSEYNIREQVIYYLTQK